LFCDVSILSLRSGNFTLTQGAVVKVKVRAQNGLGWGDFSQVNLVGATIVVEPYKMPAPTRGDLTNQ
jgi:hypothetical protein